MVVDFAAQFIHLEAENVRLQEVSKSSSEQLEKANKLAAEARGEAAKLRKELDLLKAKMEEEEQQKIEAHARAEKRKAISANLLKPCWVNCFDSFIPFFLPSRLYLIMLILHNVSRAADMPVDRPNRLRVDSMSDAISFVMDSSDQIQELLKKAKGTLSKLFSLIFPKLDQEKILDELVNAFFIDNDNTIEVLKRHSRLYGVLLAF
jgi:membrane-associated HD superfamily phosphohydrolase